MSRELDTRGKMKYEQVVAHFGGVSKTAQALGLIKQTVHAWGIRKRIPAKWQLKIEVKTGLKADVAVRREALKFASYVQRNGRA